MSEVGTIVFRIVITAIVGALTGAVTSILASKRKQKEERAKEIERQEKQYQLLKESMQALLRDRLYDLYNYCAYTKGYADANDRANFENMYSKYHGLGQNGVMDDIRNKFLALPDAKKKTRKKRRK